MVCWFGGGGGEGVDEGGRRCVDGVWKRRKRVGKEHEK
jgi:hypothetical protein